MAEERARRGESRNRAGGAKGRTQPAGSARRGAAKSAGGAPKAAGKGAPRAAKGAAKPAARRAKPAGAGTGGKPARAGGSTDRKPTRTPTGRPARAAGSGAGSRSGARGASTSRARTSGAPAGRKPTRGKPLADVRPSGASWSPDRSRRTRQEIAEPELRPGPARTRDESAPAKASSLRVVRSGKGGQKAEPKPAKPAKRTRRRAVPPGTPVGRRARGPAPGAVRDEFLRMGGPRGPKLYAQLVKAADAYAADRERDALRILRPLRAALPQSASVRELMGLSLYRSGRFDQAAEELEEYVRLCGAVDQHPALMDCYRALRNYKRIDALWAELGETSSAAEVVTEGRIVLAGSLADRGRVKEAVGVLERRAADVKNVKDHHLRLWYALADLQERAGNLPRARTLFERIGRHDPTFADVAERLAGLG